MGEEEGEETESVSEDEEETKKSLEASWRERGLRYWESIRERVPIVLFTDASSAATHIKMQRVGYGLVEPGDTSELPAIVEEVRDFFEHVGLFSLVGVN